MMSQFVVVGHGGRFCRKDRIAGAYDVYREPETWEGRDSIYQYTVIELTDGQEIRSNIGVGELLSRVERQS